MSEHDCKYESEIGTITEKLSNVETIVTNIQNSMNGPDGVISDVAVLKSDSKKQPSLRFMMLIGSIGGGITVILGLGLKALAGG